MSIELEQSWLNKKKSISERKQLFSEHIEGIMNPDNNFNPQTWDPMKNFPESELVDRKRAKPPKEMPTFGIEPKEIREGQMIGMFESKQDLYLMFAHRCNDQQAEIDELRSLIESMSKEIEILKKK